MWEIEFRGFGLLYRQFIAVGWLAILFLFSPPAFSENCQFVSKIETPAPGAIARNSIQDHFRSLAQGEALLNQNDRFLAARQLIIPNGGLCSSTCGVNFLHAASRYLGLDTRIFSKSAGLVHEIVESAWNDAGTDARRGLDFAILQRALEKMSGKIPGMKLDAKVHSLSSYTPITEKTLTLPSDTMALLTVMAGRDKSHAIVLLDIDPHTKTIWYGDPNYPGVVSSKRYTTSAVSGIPTIRILDFYDKSPESGDVRVILNVRATKSNPFEEQKNAERRQAKLAQWGRLVGKRVKMTLPDGGVSYRIITDIVAAGKVKHAPEGGVDSTFSFFGTTMSGTVPVSDVIAIDEIKNTFTPSEFQKYRDQEVSLVFEAGLSHFAGPESYRVTEIITKADTNHPFGGLKVEWQDSYGIKSSEIVPFELIKSIKVKKASNEKTPSKIVPEPIPPAPQPEPRPRPVQTLNEWKNLVGERVQVTHPGGRVSYQTISSFIEPVQGSYASQGGVRGSFSFFGASSEATIPFKEGTEIKKIRNSFYPQDYRVFKGLTVRFGFKDGIEHREGSGLYRVVEVLGESESAEHPFGGLKVQWQSQRGLRTDVVPFELIETIHVHK